MHLIKKPLRILPLLILLMVVPITGISCDDSEGISSSSSFIGDFTMEAPDYLAHAAGSFDMLKSIFSPVQAHALPNLSIDADEFTGMFPVPDETLIYILAPDGGTLASGYTDGTGRVEIDEVPEGYVSVLIVGGSGKTWSVPSHIDPEHDTYMRCVLKDNPSAQESVYGKSIHNDIGSNTNIDDFSIAVFGRPNSTPKGGYVILHEDGQTYIDTNGDGDFADAEDRAFAEADDDGIPSSEGDGDEDNDGITDDNEQGDDDDLDGDNIPNSSDTDDDGDGILDGQDQTPLGITALDDFVPPALIDPLGVFGGDPYSGIADVQLVMLDVDPPEPDPGKVRVFFPGAEDAMNNDISYRIYYDDREVDFEDSPFKVFIPAVVITEPDELYDYELTGLTTGDTWYFAVHALDSAPPPIEDDNEEMLSIELPDD